MANLSLPKSDPRTSVSSQGHHVGGSPGALSTSRISSEHQVGPQIKKSKTHTVSQHIMVKQYAPGVWRKMTSCSVFSWWSVVPRVGHAFSNYSSFCTAPSPCTQPSSSQQPPRSHTHIPRYDGGRGTVLREDLIHLSCIQKLFLLSSIFPFICGAKARGASDDCWLRRIS